MLTQTSEPITGNAFAALNELARFKNLDSLIDRPKFINRVDDKYKLNNYYELTDLYTVLLQSTSSFFPKQNQTDAITPDGALLNIERILASYPFTTGQKMKFGNKFLDLGTSSFWDTLTEFLYLDSIQKTLSSKSYSVEFEYSFGATSGGPGKDADIAILDSNKKCILLLDAITPRPIDFSKNLVTLQTIKNNIPAQPTNFLDLITRVVSDKYAKKFSKFCATNPSEFVGVLVSIIENEQLLIEYPDVLVTGNARVIASRTLKNLSGLQYCVVNTFRSQLGTDKLELAKVIDFDFK